MKKEETVIDRHTICVRVDGPIGRIITAEVEQTANSPSRVIREAIWKALKSKYPDEAKGYEEQRRQGKA